MDQVRYTKMKGVLPLEITHYLPQKATMVALLEGVGHAMPSGWSIRNFGGKSSLYIWAVPQVAPQKKLFRALYLALISWT